MRIEEFLKQHGLVRNPFANAEEALGDEILTELLERKDFQFGHPDWPKFLGAPAGNQTSIVYGMKGSGKTAMRLALNAVIKNHNRQPNDQVLLVNYDEFNDYLATWDARTRATVPKRGFWNRLLGRREQPKPIPWALADHMDALLANTIRIVIQEIASRRIDPSGWKAVDKRNVLMIGCMYLPGPSQEYFENLRIARRRMFSPLSRLSIGFLRVTAGILTLGLYSLYEHQSYHKLATRIRKSLLVVNRDIADYRRALAGLRLKHLKNQPIVGADTPHLDDTSRYQLFEKLKTIARSAGYERMVAVVDRVDEPTMISGDQARIAEFVRPLLNNKLLQSSGMHFKILLPGQLHEMIRKGDRDFLSTFRPDKQNIIHPFAWTGECLYEMLSERAATCKLDPASGFELQSLFDPAIRREEVVAALKETKLPRYAAKFMTRLLARACQDIIQQDTDNQKPLLSPKVFYKACEGIERDIVDDRRDLHEF